MGVSPHKVSQQLINHLRLSNLHFKMTETPYSAQIILKKRFLKEASGPSVEMLQSVPGLADQEFRDQNLHDQNMFLLKEISKLNNQIKEEEFVNSKSNETVALLTEKLGKAEDCALKSVKAKNEEFIVLKTLQKIVSMRQTT